MEQPAGRNVASIDTVGKHALGYDIGQVDTFLALAHDAYDQGNEALLKLDIDNVSFSLCKNGYAIDQVDAALSRLQRAVIERACVWQLQHGDHEAWREQTENIYHALAKVARRHAGERFSPGERKKPSYDRRQVDRLIDDVIVKVGMALEPERVDSGRMQEVKRLTPEMLATMLFTQRKGRRGYDERQVDYYLGVCGEVLLRLEAYRKVTEQLAISVEDEPRASMSTRAMQAEQSLPLNAHEQQTGSQPVAPLFMDSSLLQSQPVERSIRESAFDDLHKAEQQIFAGHDDGSTLGQTVVTNPQEHSDQTSRAFESVQKAADVQADNQHERHEQADQNQTVSTANEQSHRENIYDADRETDPFAKTEVFEPFFENPADNEPQINQSHTNGSYANESYVNEYHAGEQTHEQSQALRETSASEHTEASENTNDSLAALARMAESLHHVSAEDDASFSPVMPVLQPLSVQSTFDEKADGEDQPAHEHTPVDDVVSREQEVDRTGEFAVTQGEKSGETDDTTGEFPLYQHE